MLITKNWIKQNDENLSELELKSFWHKKVFVPKWIWLYLSQFLTVFDEPKTQLKVINVVTRACNARDRLTGCNWSFVPSCVGPYSHTYLYNFRSLNHQKQSRIGWDMAKNIFICNSNICPFRFCHISVKSWRNCLNFWSVYRELNSLFMYAMYVR